MQLLKEDPTVTKMLHSQMKMMLASLKAVHVERATADALAAVAEAASHDAAGASLQHLVLQANCSAEWCRHMAGADWPSAFNRLLSATPSSVQDHELWSVMLRLLSKLLGTQAASKDALHFLVMTLQQHSLPLLEAAAEVGAVAASGRPHPQPHPAGGESEGRGATNTKPTTAPVLRHPMVAGHNIGTGESRRHVLALVDAAAAALQLLIEVLKQCQAQGDGVFMCRVLTVLMGSRLHSLLVQRYLAKHDADYGCRVLAARCVCQLAEMVVLAEGNTPGPPPAGSAWGDTLATAVEPMVRQIAALRYDQEWGMIGRGLLREALGALHAVAGGSSRSWHDVWRASGGSYWLTRLARDREGRVRTAVLALLALVAGPYGRATRAWLSQTWPEAPGVMVRVAMDGTECAATRAEALHFVSMALLPECGGGMAAPGALPAAEAHSLEHAPPTDFKVLPLLQRRHFWEQLPSLLAKSAPMVLKRGASAALLAAAQVDADPPAEALEATHAWPVLMQLLDDAADLCSSVAVDPVRARGSGRATMAAEQRDRIDLLATAANTAAVIGVLAQVGGPAPQDRGAALGLSALPRLLRLVQRHAGFAARAPPVPVDLSEHATQQQRVRVVENACSTACRLLACVPAAAAAAAVRIATDEGSLPRCDPPDKAAAARGAAPQTFCQAAALLCEAPTGRLPRSCQLAVCRLLATLFRSSEAAGLLLRCPAEASCSAVQEQHSSPGTEDTEVGKMLCKGLMSLLWAMQECPAWRLQDSDTPGGMLSGALDGPGSWRPGGVQHSAASARMVAGTALRNLLAYSHGAKAAALQESLPRTLLVLVADARARAQQMADAARHAHTMRRTDAHRPVPSESAAITRPTSSSAAKNSHGKAGPRATCKARPERGSRSTSSRTGKQQSTDLPGVRAKGAARAQQKAETADGDDSAYSSAVGKEPEMAVGGERVGPRSTDASGMDQQEMIVLEIVQAVSILKHLAFSSQPSAAAVATSGDEKSMRAVREACIKSGAVPTMLSIWLLARNDEGLLHEVLGFTANLCHNCEAAKLAVVGETDPGGGQASVSLMSRIMKLALQPATDSSSFTLGFKVFQVLAGVAGEAQAIFLRTGFVAECEKLLRNLIKVVLVGNEDSDRINSLLKGLGRCICVDPVMGAVAGSAEEEGGVRKECVRCKLGSWWDLEHMIRRVANVGVLRTTFERSRQPIGVEWADSLMEL
ncbi:hypothetical protein CYMTET_16591 [Cymbomonas tetramitiformis]|uniref:Uncharacterized protein n=1 Tax=Cymbomonas tetramitiformis TaxID=36881 RepID=A0AAE0GC06_9CHLO|nr:hypothetical protein CYMTET_16591 [Cymbomonas tetramitiformis]